MMNSLSVLTVMGVLLAVPAWADTVVDQGNGAVTDTLTKLTWQQADDGTTRTWEPALGYCEGLTLAGYDDWRLPNYKELVSITDDSRYNPAINPLFPNTKVTPSGGVYWTSTTSGQYTTYALVVTFASGTSSIRMKGTDLGYVRCVRSGQ